MNPDIAANHALESARRAVRQQRLLGASAATFAALAVGLWAWVAHAPLPAGALAPMERAVLMLLVHGSAVVALAPQAVTRGQRRACMVLLAAAALFAGSVLLHHLAQVPPVLAPVGGTGLIAGWLWLAWARWRG